MLAQVILAGFWHRLSQERVQPTLTQVGIYVSQLQAIIERMHHIGPGSSFTVYVR